MTNRAQRRWLTALLVLVVACAVAFVVQCSRNGGRARLVEQFDNGPMLKGPDGKPRTNPGPSEGFRWVGENDSPSPGKHWRTVHPDDLTPEQRKQIR